MSSNGQYMHGYDIQVEEYAKAEQTDNMVYVLVDVGNPVKVKKLLDRYNRDIDEGKNLLKNSSIEEKKQYINKIEINPIINPFIKVLIVLNPR